MILALWFRKSSFIRFRSYRLFNFLWSLAFIFCLVLLLYFCPSLFKALFSSWPNTVFSYMTPSSEWLFSYLSCVRPSLILVVAWCVDFWLVLLSTCVAFKVFEVGGEASSGSLYGALSCDLVCAICWFLSCCHYSSISVAIPLAFLAKQWRHCTWSR